MSVNVVRFGPGEFSLGIAPGTDFSCQVQSMGVNVNKDEGDAITVLCGDQVPGSITYTYSLAGTVLQDIATASGLIQYSWEHEGEETDFSFTPSDAAGIAVIAGKVIMDPLPLGTSDGAYGDVLTSEFEWSCAGKPDVTWPSGVAAAASSSREPQPAGA